MLKRINCKLTATVIFKMTTCSSQSTDSLTVIHNLASTPFLDTRDTKEGPYFSSTLEHNQVALEPGPRIHTSITPDLTLGPLRMRAGAYAQRFRQTIVTFPSSHPRMTVAVTKHHTILKNPDKSNGRGRELELTFHVYSVYGAAFFTLPDRSGNGLFEAKAARPCMQRPGQ